MAYPREITHQPSLSQPSTNTQDNPCDIEYAFGQIFGALALILTKNQVIQLYRALEYFSQDEFISSVENCRKEFVSFDSSQQQPVISEHFSADNTACYNNSWGQGDTKETPDFPNQLTLPPANPLDGLSLNVSNTIPNSKKPFCMSCHRQCKSFDSLRKHQREFCERNKDWVCPQCPEVFGLGDRLERHHLGSHIGIRPCDCNKNEGTLGDSCKARLGKCQRPAPAKKAWGCPCCVRCFAEKKLWNIHKDDHRIGDKSVENWSFTTMIQSLLAQDHLLGVSSSDQWRSYDWSSLVDDDRLTLRYALERHCLPPSVRENQEYAYLDDRRALVCYTYSLGTLVDIQTTTHDNPGEETAPAIATFPSLANIGSSSVTDQATNLLQPRTTIPEKGHSIEHTLGEVCQDNPALTVSGTVASHVSDAGWDHFYSQIADDGAADTMWSGQDQDGNLCVDQILHEDKIFDSRLPAQSKETFNYRLARTLDLSQKDQLCVHKHQRKKRARKEEGSSKKKKKKKSLRPHTQHAISEVGLDEQLFYGDITSAE